MFKVYKKEIEIAGKKISLETGKVASQIGGSAGPPPSFRLALRSFKCLGPMTNGEGEWGTKLKDVGVKHATKLFYVPRLRGGIIGGKRRKKSRRMTRRKRGRGRKKTRRKRKTKKKKRKRRKKRRKRTRRKRGGMDDGCANYKYKLYGNTEQKAQMRDRDDVTQAAADKYCKDINETTPKCYTPLGKCAKIDEVGIAITPIFTDSDIQHLPANLRRSMAQLL